MFLKCNVVRRLVQQGHNINEKTRTHDLGYIYLNSLGNLQSIIICKLVINLNLERAIYDTMRKSYWFFRYFLAFKEINQLIFTKWVKSNHLINILKANFQ